MAEPRPRSDYIVPCPSCGQEKWKYQGSDLDHEPPCANCGRATAGAPT